MAERSELVIGQVFGRLTVLGEAEPRAGLRALLCRCVCEFEFAVLRSNLATGKTRSCGCLKADLAKTHGLSKTPAYVSWKSMLGRCYDSSSVNYKNYGGRGITVDPRWLDFKTFLSDMGPRPEGMSIERKYVDSGYSPQNCSWADAKTQANNRRNNVIVAFGEIRMTLAQAVSASNVSRAAVNGRRRAGWPEEDWLKPAGYKRNKPTKVTI